MYDGKASEDYISAYLEYVQNKSEKSFRVIVGCLLLLYKYEYPQYTGENYRKIELSEVMQIAEYLIVNSPSGLLSEDEVNDYQAKMSVWNNNRLYNFYKDLDNPLPEMKSNKNQDQTMIVFESESTIENALFYIDNDLMFSETEVYIEVLNHYIKYNLKKSELLDLIKDNVERYPQIHYNGDYYRLSNMLYYSGQKRNSRKEMTTMRIFAGGKRYPQLSMKEII